MLPKWCMQVPKLAIKVKNLLQYDEYWLKQDFTNLSWEFWKIMIFAGIMTPIVKNTYVLCMKMVDLRVWPTFKRVNKLLTENKSRSVFSREMLHVHLCNSGSYKQLNFQDDRPSQDSNAVPSQGRRKVKIFGVAVAYI